MRKVWDAQNRVGQSFTPAIRKALADSWDVDKLVEAWGNAKPSHVWSKQQIVDWVRLHVVFDNMPLSKVLTKVWAAGYEFGLDSANYAMALAEVNKADKPDTPDTPTVTTGSKFDWENWVPGNIAAAVIVNPVGGFAKRLAERNITLKGVNDTTVNRIGTVLANGLSEGLSPVAVATDVAGELVRGRTDWANVLAEKLQPTKDDFRRAEVIARTEMNRAVIDEKTDRYQEMGVDRWEWVVVDPCDICAENDGEVRAVGDEFPSGDTQPLVHVNCNCDLLPDLSEFTSGLYDDTEKAIRPEFKNKIPPTIGIPSSLEMDRALSRLDILPNPIDAKLSNPMKYVESPWAVVDVPTIDPNIWDNAIIKIVDLNDLFGTDVYLKRKRVKHHIESMGQALTPFRSYAMVLEKDGQQIIIDGHHRLMSHWLLGLDKAPVWFVKETL